VSCRI